LYPQKRSHQNPNPSIWHIPRKKGFLYKPHHKILSCSRFSLIFSSCLYSCDSGNPRVNQSEHKFQISLNATSKNTNRYSTGLSFQEIYHPILLFYFIYLFSFYYYYYFHRPLFFPQSFFEYFSLLLPQVH